MDPVSPPPTPPATSTRASLSSTRQPYGRSCVSASAPQARVAHLTTGFLSRLASPARQPVNNSDDPGRTNPCQVLGGRQPHFATHLSVSKHQDSAMEGRPPMRFWDWVKDHQVQATIGVVATVLALAVGVLALARDVTNFQLGSDEAATPPDTSVTDTPTHGSTTGPTPTLTSERPGPTVRRGPVELRMAGGQVTGTEIDLDSEAPNWDVNNCASGCDINFRGNLNGIEEANGQMAEASATYESCQAATTYGFTIGPREAKTGLETCVLTDEGRTAGLVVGKVTRSDPDHVEQITLTVTVWE